MIRRRRQDERKQLFQITACFAWSWSRQCWGQALFGCGSLWLSGTIFINLAGWAPGLEPMARPLPCSSSRQEKSSLSLSSRCENHLPDRGASGPRKSQPRSGGVLCNQATLTALKTAMTASGNDPGKVIQEIREWHKAKGREEPNPNTASNEMPLVIYTLTFPKLQMNHGDADILSSSPLLDL